MTTYRCTNPTCGWKGKISNKLYYTMNGILRCQRCLWPLEDLDFLERAAIREESPMSRDEAERLAVEDMEKVCEDMAT